MSRLSYRKSVFKSFILLLSCGIFTGCSDDDEPIVSENSWYDPVKELIAPVEGEEIHLSDNLSEEVKFEWKRAAVSSGVVVYYDLVFGKEGDEFEQPVATLRSNEYGKKNTIILSHQELDEIWSKAGFAAGERGELLWSIKTSDELTSVMADVSRKLTFTRTDYTYEIPNELYVTGEGSEAGINLMDALPFKRVSEGEFVIYTRLEAGQDFKVVTSREENTTLFFYIQNQQVRRKDLPNTVNQTGVYRIHINFNTEVSTIQYITDFGLYFPLQGRISMKLDYQGHGIWDSSNQIGYMPLAEEWWGLEVRYRFRMEVTDERGNHSVVDLGPVDRDAPDASRWYIKEVSKEEIANDNFSNVWDFDRGLNRKTVYVEVSLDAGREFTHLIREDIPFDHSSWVSIADRSTSSFLDAYWTTSHCFSNDIYGNVTWNDYWPEAHGLDVVTDAYLRTNDARYRQVIYDFYEGVRIKNWASNNWWNEYYDDMAWHGLAHLRAFEATGDERYEGSAEDLWRWLPEGWSDHEGGGIAWNNKPDGQGKGVPSNGPATIIAIRRWVKYGDSEIVLGENDLEWALKIYEWMRTHRYVAETGRVFENFEDTGQDWSYNFGTFMGAAMELYNVTGDRMYLDDAIRTADYALQHKTNNQWILSDWAEQNDHDVNLFKAIFIRYFTRLIMHPDLFQDKRNEYIDFMKHNALAVWSLGTITEPYILYSYRWWLKPDDPNNRPKLRAQISGCTLMEAMALLVTEGYIK